MNKNDRPEGRDLPEVIAAIREERARLVRIANWHGPFVMAAAIGFIRCKATHGDTGQHCQRGEGHRSVGGYVIHAGESVTWPEQSDAD